MYHIQNFNPTSSSPTCPPLTSTTILRGRNSTTTTKALASMFATLASKYESWWWRPTLGRRSSSNGETLDASHCFAGLSLTLPPFFVKFFISKNLNLWLYIKLITFIIVWNFFFFNLYEDIISILNWIFKKLIWGPNILTFIKEKRNPIYLRTSCHVRISCNYTLLRNLTKEGRWTKEQTRRTIWNSIHLRKELYTIYIPHHNDRVQSIGQTSELQEEDNRVFSLF